MVKFLAHRAGFPGDGKTITGSALTPVLESVAALPAHRAGHLADLPAIGLNIKQRFQGGRGNDETDRGIKEDVSTEISIRREDL
jgi:hypothetical protein